MMFITLYILQGQSTLVERVRSYSTNDLRLQQGEDEIDARYIDDSDEEFGVYQLDLRNRSALAVIC